MSDNRSYLYDVICVMGSIGSSVGLILVNKLLMSSLDLNFVLILTAIHLLINCIALEVMAVLGTFVRKRMPLVDTAVMAVYCVGSIASLNFSLQINSLWFYQGTKLLCFPVMVLMHADTGTGFSRIFTATLALVTVCFGIAAVTDFDVNLIGVVFAAVAVYSTAKSQVLQGNKQSEQTMNAVQYNHMLALPSFILCSTLALAMEFIGYNHSSYLDSITSPTLKSP